MLLNNFAKVRTNLYVEVSSCSLIATTRGRDAYLCISTSCLAISVLYVSQVFKRVILQQNKHYFIILVIQYMPHFFQHTENLPWGQ